jgi:hypothetical protein
VSDVPSFPLSRVAVASKDAEDKDAEVMGFVEALNVQDEGTLAGTETRCDFCLSNKSSRPPLNSTLRAISDMGEEQTRM